jgi:tRNA A-37 threonylcarbamoyl transferase component Bud32
VTEETAITSFNFQPGRIIAGRYRVLSFLGGGLEGEVYLVAEYQTGIERAVKLFYPKWNRKGETSRRYATKLHRLRHCPIIIQYHGQGTLRFKGHEVSYVVSEYAPGEVLSHLLARQTGRRLSPLAACHLLHALAAGLESVHAAGEYHGDLHTENVIVLRFGLTFELKVLDFFPREGRRRVLMQDDIIDVVKIFYESLGGASQYRKQPDEVKAICRGLKHSLILERFPTIGALRRRLESFEWG